MSDRIVQPYPDYDGIAGQSVHSYQSVWMAHWTQTTCNVAPQMHSPSDISRSAEGFNEVEARTFGIMNDSVTMSLRNENLVSRRPVEIVDLESGSPKNEKGTSHMQGLRSQFDHKIRYMTKALCTRSSHFPSALAMASLATEGVSQNQMEQANSHIVVANSSFSPSRPLENDFIGSSSHTVPRKFEQGAYKFDSGRTAVTSFMRGQEEIASKEHLSNTNMRIFEQGHHNYHGDSTLLFSEKITDNCLDSHLRHNRTPLLPNIPRMSNNHSSVRGGEQYQRNRSGKFFPSQSSPPEMTESEKLHHGDSMLQKMPQSVHDESLRICTSLNSVEGLTEVPPRFSQTARGFLITEETNVNLCEENQILRESRVLTRFEGNTSSGTHSLFPLFGFGQQGVKLQPLCSSTDGEEKEENVQDFKASGVPNNESSAETDTMDMDSLKENPFSGVKSSPSNKVSAVDLKFPTKEVAGRRLITELPDINVRLPALPDGAISMDKPEPSTSRTQSLDMERMLAPSNQPSNSKSIHCPHDPMESEPSSRWIKRLKLSSSNTKGFFGTTSSNLDEALTHKKVNKFFKIMKGSSSRTSEPTLGNHVDLAKKDGDINLSHPWIQRWRGHHDLPPTQQKKPEPVVICEPQSSNLEDFQKKQFPSTAAMALMGKAMSGFQPCEFRKRGSFVVWNIKGF